MSRLDSFIRRVTAQRDCLNAAAELVRDLSGPVLEFGLGNGRTYDHLRSLLPGRPIFVFERQVAAHPDCIPPDECLLLGDLHETLEGASAVIERRRCWPMSISDREIRPRTPNWRLSWRRACTG